MDEQGKAAELLGAEHFSHQDGWQDSCKLISGWRSPVGHKKQSILEGERQVLDKQQQQTTKNIQILEIQAYPDSEEGCF